MHHLYDVLGSRISTELPDSRRLNHLVYGSCHMLQIKKASNDARVNPFKEPPPPPQGSPKQVRIRGYYHGNQIGTPREPTSSSGELVWHAQYKVWGNTIKVEWLQGPSGQEAGFE